MDKNEIFLSAQRALLFNVLSSTRFIFIKLYKNCIDLTIISDKELDEIEKDIYHAVSAEIVGDFTTVDDSHSNIYFKFNTQPFEYLTLSSDYGDLIFARYEV